MNIKSTIVRTLSFVSLLLVAQAEETKPNVLFIFSDDQVYEAIGAYGLIDIDTPNLDRLANEGTSFSKAYNMGAWTGAICRASRSSMNSGRFIWQAEAASQAIGKGELQSWSQLMAERGYETYMSGKWHVPEVSVPKVFDHTGTVRGGMPKQTPSGYNRPKNAVDYEKGWKPWDTSKGGYWLGGKHWSEVLADEGVGFIEMAAKKERPFFMYLAFNAPHDPRQAPKEYIDRYPLERIQVPENFVPQYADQGNKGVPIIRDEKLMPFPRTEYAVKVNRQEYYALITHMDEQIGRILAALDASGKADNTWIIFTSDHGLSLGHHGLVGKQNMYEDAMAAPFIVWGPGVKSGQKLDTPIYIQDAMATALDIGGEVPEGIDFKSVLPLLNGSSEQIHDSIYGAYIDTQRMLLQDGWKLIAYPKLKKVKLFNLEKDPQEMHDLSQNPEYAERLQMMIQSLEERMDSLGDPMESLSKANYPKKKKKKVEDH
ncbi:sulfatase-like hydrolase/transferase [Coraliomargarita sp. SDUM461004]|uniref:Sulfatase-like hydrolase/transferase n=1 Tax=Thalassobacterium sedimentorum TaxID=3041258 RepID=A0ABU1AR68_9BACT|nr:sulfatase-like hydrolase/transferase [Coraliomargarita sp. SDUM461004]MDQ8196266.1 sulfatase-like hydrolase/transferase [Coraliomargarita sp. SDUM461004]